MALQNLQGTCTVQTCGGLNVLSCTTVLDRFYSSHTVYWLMKDLCVATVTYKILLTGVGAYSLKLLRMVAVFLA